MPGVQTGDMGPKMGFNSKDNGWMTFDNVRVPRENMPCRYLKVDREGSVSIEGDIRALYSSMLATRAGIATHSKFYLAPAILIGLRYSIVRRQFKNISNKKEETKLLDYQTQQMKLLPALAGVFAISASSHYVIEKIWKLKEDIKTGNFELLELSHHYAAGMKSIVT